MLGGDNYSMIECPMAMERSTGKWRCTNTESAPNCPRCASTNTKFCYYNNYSLSQPRYFCKGCRRYWTKGGSLRNVPVGGGCRKSRRTRASRLAGSPNNYSAQTLARQRGAGGSAGGGATDIDLAAVFARYVSQNVGENDVSGSPGGSSGSSENNPAGVSEIDCQYLDDVTMLEYQTPLDLINGGEDQVIPGGTMMNGQDLVFQDCIGYDSGMLWSGEGTSLSNYEWQQMDDLGNFLSQDQTLRSESPNLCTENWGFFDLSAYEYYSTP